MAIESFLVDLGCPRCGQSHDADRLQRFCPCGGPLFARYDLPRAASAWDRGKALVGRDGGMWRYAELLPVRDPRCRVHLGEGSTPLLEVGRIGEDLGLTRLIVKDEGLNPTGSFKARGLAAAVSRALELGAETLALPTAGNAGSALAAYCARAGIGSVVYMPLDTPEAFVTECRHLGAVVRQVPGSIADAGAMLAKEAAEKGWFLISTLQEPYRLEGKKTMGFELAEQLGWELPEVILYPTGGGTGLIGMWKAFDELEALGILDGRRPRMVTVQASRCAPIVRAFEAGEESASAWESPETVANGLRVPRAFADREILEVLRSSSGDAVAVTDEEMLEMVTRLGSREGIYPAPEAAATLVAAGRMVADGRIRGDESVLAFLTGNAYKYQASIPAS